MPSSNLAETALVVRDDWPNKGLGTALFKYLAEIAIRNGLTGFTAWVLTSNSRMIHILRKSGYPMRYRIEGDLYHVEIELGKQA